MRIHRYLFILLLLIITIEVQAQTVAIDTEYGQILVELYPDKAPVTVANFMKYVKGGHYRGGSFFRTVTMDNQPDNKVKITVIQAGSHPWSQNFLFDPILLERTRDTGVKHTNGAISMARGEPDSAQDSFFICLDDQPELDYGGARNPDGQGFAAFGTVKEGMEIVRKINRSSAEGQALIPPVLINEISVVED